MVPAQANILDILLIQTKIIQTPNTLLWNWEQEQQVAKITHRPAKPWDKSETGSVISLESEITVILASSDSCWTDHGLRLIFVSQKSCLVQLGLDKYCVRFCATRQGTKALLLGEHPPKFQYLYYFHKKLKLQTVFPAQHPWTHQQLLRAVGGISLWTKSVLATTNIQEKLIDGGFSKINHGLMELLH